MGRISCVSTVDRLVQVNPCLDCLSRAHRAPLPGKQAGLVHGAGIVSCPMIRSNVRLCEEQTFVFRNSIPVDKILGEATLMDQEPFKKEVVWSWLLNFPGL